MGFSGITPICSVEIKNDLVMTTSFTSSNPAADVESRSNSQVDIAAKKATDVRELRERLAHLNELYRQGNPEVSDVEYDALVEQLRQLAPNDKFFASGVVEKASKRMETLPVPMFSLEKVKTDSALYSWLKRMWAAGCRNIVITPKYDGISLVVNELTGCAWTRGDGVQGQRSDSHFSRMNNGECDRGDVEIVWGEAICPKKQFMDIQRSSGYKNARNMVAGLFNSASGANTEAITVVDFVRYGTNLSAADKQGQLIALQKRYDNATIFQMLPLGQIMSGTDDVKSFMDYLDELHDLWGEKYQIDGLVLEVNENSVRDRLGRLPNNNPDYAVAYKREEWQGVHHATVTGIEWKIGKDGCATPVILIEPVQIGDVTVSRVTGYNASYLFQNNIAEGSVVEIIRSGDVIPKHIRTTYFQEECVYGLMASMRHCPRCGKELHWDSTHTELVCSNPVCPDKVVARAVYFFRTLKCEGFDEPIIRKLFNAGAQTISNIAFAPLEKFQYVLGENKGLAVYNEIQDKVVHPQKQPLSRLLTALNLFAGVIGEKTVQMILDNSPAAVYLIQAFHQPLTKDICEIVRPELLAIRGVGNEVAEAFLQGLSKYIGKNYPYPFTYIQTPEPTTAAATERLYVCMTGFRDAELEDTLLRQGHEVLGGVTSRCNVLVVADMASTSSKMQKAQKLGIRIVDRKIFTDEILGR